MGGGLIIEANIPVQELEGQRGEGAYFREDTVLVESHTQGTLHSQLHTIVLSSTDCRVLLRISECQSNVDHLIVVPRCGYQVPALTKGRLTAIALLYLLANLSRVLFRIRTNSTTGICQGHSQDSEHGGGGGLDKISPWPRPLIRIT